MPAVEEPPRRFEPTAHFRLPPGTAPLGGGAAPDATALCVAYNPTSTLLAVGSMDGQVHLYQTTQHYKPCNYTLNQTMCEGRALTGPVTSLSFRPALASEVHASSHGVLLVTSADGGVARFHLGSQQLLHTVTEAVQDEELGTPGFEVNQVFSSAYRADGEMFATGGLDGGVRLYDEQTGRKLCTMTLGAEDGVLQAHRLNVTALHFAGDSRHTILSGGWDRTVQVWDVRANRSVLSIYGPYLTGDGLALHPDGNTLLTASTRSDDALQAWDVRTGKPLVELRWPTEPRAATAEAQGIQFAASKLVACGFSPSGHYFAAGGNHDFRVFRTGALLAGGSESTSCAVVGELSAGGGSRKPVFGVAWQTRSEQVAAVGDECVVLETAIHKSGRQ